MSERTVSAQAEVDWIMLVARGSVQRDMLSADRKRWHKALRHRAREAGRTVEVGITAIWRGRYSAIQSMSVTPLPHAIDVRAERGRRHPDPHHTRCARSFQSTRHASSSILHHSPQLHIHTEDARVSLVHL